VVPCLLDAVRPPSLQKELDLLFSFILFFHRGGFLILCGFFFFRAKENRE
jgi:hypothetical protein